jgi:hypothetical protein
MCQVKIIHQLSSAHNIIREVTHCVLTLRSLHETNKYRANHVCLSILPSDRMISVENSWADLDEIWYGHYAIEVYSKIVPLISYSW